MDQLTNCIDRKEASSCFNFVSQSVTRVIKDGGLVVFPTSSVYGLAGDAMRKDVVMKIFSVKNRSLNKPISVIISNINQLKYVAKCISNRTMFLMKKYWPGKITFIVEASDSFPDVLTSGTGKIGVRIPLNKIALALVNSYGSPVTATSANVSGKSGAKCVKDIGDSVLNAVNLVVNIGSLKGGAESTIVDTTVDPIEILREGALTATEFI